MADKKSEFVVSARKYRPANWGEVVGQDSITDTLRNSIEQEHLAHAYLFCGPRGVGKTTCARIFAKEINHAEGLEDEDFSFNIFELDAASNNGVDDIRNLTDQVRIPPQVGIYKVYIIDEVHMLSKPAFNAFLKTLEEPPKHAIFILATTEKHKIIPTILSRCQIYDFNRIPVDEIVKHLREIAKKEKITFEEEALHVVAQKADGALRDALSIFDQLSSFTNQNLTYEAVLKNLHVLDYDYYFKLVNHLIEGDYSQAMLLLDEILKLGFDAGHFVAGLGSHLRDLLVCQEPQTIHLLEVGDTVKKQYYDQSKSVDPNWILAALKEIQQCEFRIRNSMNQRLLLEVTLLSLAALGLEKKNTEFKPLGASKRTIKEPAAPNSIPNPLDTSPTKTEQKSEIRSHTESSEPKNEAIELAQEPKPDKIDPITPVAESAQSANARKRRKPTTISLNISSPIKESEPVKSIGEIIEEKPETLNPVETFEIKDAWKKACEQSLEHGKNRLYATLIQQNFEDIFSDNTITVGLRHGVEEEEFSHHSADLLQTLRQLTGNQNLQLNSILSEQTSDAQLFTSKDKFEHLAKQNPNLLKLKKELDLDIQ